MYMKSKVVHYIIRVQHWNKMDTVLVHSQPTLEDRYYPCHNSHRGQLSATTFAKANSMTYGHLCCRFKGVLLGCGYQEKFTLGIGCGG